MKDKYNIKINPPELSSEQIKQHQNFEALLANFKQAPTTPEAPPTAPVELEVVKDAPQKRRRFVYIASAVVTVLAASLVYSILRQPLEVIENYQPPTVQIQEVLALQSPLPSLEQPVERKTMQAEQGETLTYASGSRVTIPAAAFVDKEGTPVKGEVEITYREFNDPVDMFLAGVPKQLNKHQDLQSTGMMEIKGFQNGEPVYLTMDKSLDIELKGKMVVGMDTDDLGVYVYSRQEDSWSYKTKDRVEVVNNTATTDDLDPTTDDPALAAVITQLKQEQRSTKPIEPIRPGVPAGMQVFDFAIDVESSPELAKYNQNIDLMTPISNVSVATFKDTIWNDMELQGNEDEGYVLRLEYQGEGGVFTRTLEVQPVVVATDEAKAQYQAEKARYEAALQTWEADIVAAAQAQVQRPEQWVNIINRFAIQRFGLWNCGKPIEGLLDKAVNTQFVDLQGAPIALQEVFVATEQQQFYYSSPSANNGSELPLPHQQEQKIWALSAQGELLVAEVSPDVLEGAAPVLPMRPIAVPETAADLRELLTM
jgi:hypothetical protein